ncbi:Hsp20/alpha crystallin family protein [Patescibacteria group bacterium]|nr:Hsp20/alpha crystallin family protein [Patescibacteria group bacterium]
MNQFDWQPTEEGQLAVDVIETPEQIIIRAAIAGVEPDDIEINVTDDLVTVRGNRQENKTTNSATYHFQECFWGSFSRSIVLPCHINPDGADANFKNGILTLTLPKSHGEMRVPIRKEL